MILVCGATGHLGGRIVQRLVEDGREVRALVRPATDATTLENLGVEIVRGDLRDPASLDAPLAGVDTVVTTANAIGRLLAGPTDLSITAVDRDGNANLVRAAERAGPVDGVRDLDAVRRPGEPDLLGHPVLCCHGPIVGRTVTPVTSSAVETGALRVGPGHVEDEQDDPPDERDERDEPQPPLRLVSCSRRQLRARLGMMVASVQT